MSTPTLDRDATDDDVLLTSLTLEAPAAPPGLGPEGELDLEPDLLDVAVRPLLVAACSSLAAALTVGGIFGSSGARALGAAAALAGVGWAWLTARSARRRNW